VWLGHSETGWLRPRLPKDLDPIDERRSSKSFQLLIAGVAPSVDMRFLAPAAVTGSLDLKLATHYQTVFQGPTGRNTLAPTSQT